MSRLDCNTHTGKRYISHQIACIETLAAKWECDIAYTDETESVDIDGIALRGGKVTAVLEIKSRETDLEQLNRWGSYLVTFDKVMKIRDVAKRLGVPGLLVVSLLKDQTIVFWKICDARGNMLVRMGCETTTTQATCNGGETDRYNAYLSLDDMKILP